MKPTLHFVPITIPAKCAPYAALVLLSTFNAQLSTCLAQGNLTPPGPPTNTFKTLEQVEPRVPIDAAHTPGDADSVYRIARPGSYYLTTNLAGAATKHGIEIVASGVTLDLMGFDLLGVTGSLNGIHVSATVTNLVVRNGSLRNWGDRGVDAGSAENGLYEKLQLAANGTDGADDGLNCGANSVMIHCIAFSNGGDGIEAFATSRRRGWTVVLG